MYIRNSERHRNKKNAFGWCKLLRIFVRNLNVPELNVRTCSCLINLGCLILKFTGDKHLNFVQHQHILLILYMLSTANILFSDCQVWNFYITSVIIYMIIHNVFMICLYESYNMICDMSVAIVQRIFTFDEKTDFRILDPDSGYRNLCRSYKPF